MESFYENEPILIPVSGGEEQCDPGHFWGPGIRNHYVIHYVISGKGVFYCNQKKYNLTKGQLFIIFPNTLINYYADLEEPWHYSWIVFNGNIDKFLKSSGISRENPVITPINKDRFPTLIRAIGNIKNTALTEKLKSASLLYDFMTELIREDSPESVGENIYFNHAINYINAHYSEDITIEKIASEIGISRKYLFAIFKKTTGVSPKNYLLDYRIKKACKLLSDKTLSIGNVAYSTGYKDQLTFSRMFKKKTGKSPTLYREETYSLH